MEIVSDYENVEDVEEDLQLGKRSKPVSKNFQKTTKGKYIKYLIIHYL